MPKSNLKRNGNNIVLAASLFIIVLATVYYCLFFLNFQSTYRIRWHQETAVAVVERYDTFTDPLERKHYRWKKMATFEGIAADTRADIYVDNIMKKRKKEQKYKDGWKIIREER